MNALSHAQSALLDLVLINAMLALSQYAVLRAGVFSLASAGLAAIGAYTAGVLTVRFGVPAPLGGRRPDRWLSRGKCAGPARLRPRLHRAARTPGAGDQAGDRRDQRPLRGRRYELARSLRHRHRPETASFGYPEIDAGLFPMLAMAVARRGLPAKVAFDLFYSGRRMRAEEALGHHFVTAIVPAAEVLTEARAAVARLSEKSAVALAMGRQAFWAMAAMDPRSALEHAQTALVSLLAAAERGHRSL